MSHAETSKSGKVNHSWYAATVNRRLQTLGGLQGEINCDVCVIGAGFTGLSAAYELSRRGYSVTLIEANTVASMASGRNGGHLLRGYSKSPSGLDAASVKTMCDLTLETFDEIVARIERHKIACDLRFGAVTAGLNQKHGDALKFEIDEWAAMGHTELKYLDKDGIQGFVKGNHYVCGMHDPRGGHFHPLNYALGLAQAAQDAGCRIYENTRALAVEPGSPARVVTENGAIKASFVIIGGYIELKGAEAANRKVIGGTAHMIATEPLPDPQAFIPQNVSVTDANFLMNYFRLSSDNRILFGGTCNYSALELPMQSQIVKQRLVEVFPALKDIRIDYFWGGLLDFTANRLPHLGRLAPNVFFAHGFSGHGIIPGSLAGQVMAEAVAGTAERFDVFARIRHMPFVGGDLLKQPLFVLGMVWYRLRDFLSN